jgi:GNAT superfamily N-acetyltransferase
MASTEHEPSGLVRRLAESDLPGALELSASAHWNQNAADWLTMLALGDGWGIDDVDAQGRERLAASIVVLPYGRAFAWVSMVLVLPGFQRRGHASRLLRHALSRLEARGMAGVLDATPVGHAVYAQEGFVDTWGFARYRREGVGAIDPRPGPATRALREADWPEIAALDAPAFGADRQPLLRRLAQRWPQAARVAVEAGRLRGFVLGRDGREARQIGPLLADDLPTAMRLIGDVLSEASGPLYLDLLDAKNALLPWLQQQGFAFQRPFTRMVHGTSSAPGDPRSIVLAAGPELG